MMGQASMRAILAGAYAVVLSAPSALVSAAPADVLAERQLVPPDPPTKIPPRATADDLRYQPAVDFDRDSCYNVPALGCDGFISEGLLEGDAFGKNMTTFCRDPEDLVNSNVYSRKRCNTGWCAYIYGYYFEKDVTFLYLGHKHDWEHIIVYVPWDEDAGVVRWVCASQHSTYECLPENQVQWIDDHPKMIYHKDSLETHNWRHAGPTETPENDSGEWQLADLISWNGFPTSELRDRLDGADFGSAAFGVGKGFPVQIERTFPSNCEKGACSPFPYPFDKDLDEEGSPGFPQEQGDQCKQPPPLEPRPRPSELRIMPLGASIMMGWGSSWGEGIRRLLRDVLRADGFNVNMVGSRSDSWEDRGRMKDSDHEGWPGNVISQVHNNMFKSVAAKPNIVLINAGTNDANQALELPTIRTRLESLLRDIYSAPGMSSACIILSTLLKSGHSVGREHYQYINNVIEDVFEQFKGDSANCIYLARLDTSAFDLPADYISDLIHPNDRGHAKMASVFWAEIRQALRDNQVRDPEGDIPDEKPDFCDKQAGTGISAGGLTQRGSGDDDGVYQHSSQDMDIVTTITSSFDRDQWRFARLFNQDFDDLVGWWNETANDHMLGVWKNSADGKGSFARIGDIKMNMYCIPRGLHLIDMNADGLDDIVCVSPSGDLHLALNNGDGNHASNKLPTFRPMGQIMQNKGVPQGRIRLGDIDGDGRGDYIIDTENNGNWQVYRNGWVHDTPDYWQGLGTRFTAKGKGNLDGVRFDDLNGDGRDDWIFVEADGRTDVYTNSRSCHVGKDGDGLNVAWRQAQNKDYTSGAVYTHSGMAGLMEDKDEDIRHRVHFARIYGSPSASGNRPRKDYVFLQHNKQGGDQHRFRMRVWKNTGGGATKLKADGNKYCNMVGHTNGMDDYVWTWSTGKMDLFVNRGQNHVDAGVSFWDDIGTIWTPPGGRVLDRRDLHLADYDGDGTCDIIYADPASGKIEVWINQFAKLKRWEWNYLANPASSVRCSEKRGLGIHDLGIRLADLTGNGRTDYLCIQKDGTTRAWVQNDQGGWEDIGQIKFSEQKDRANLRWHDVNGDGKADMIFVDKFSGDSVAWYNEGRVSPGGNSGSSIRWRKGDGNAYDGRFAGTCMYFPDLNGDGRADLHQIRGTFVNDAETDFSPSCGSSDHTGDDGNGPPQNPGLPEYPIKEPPALPPYFD